MDLEPHQEAVLENVLKFSPASWSWPEREHPRRTWIIAFAAKGGDDSPFVTLEELFQLSGTP